MHIVQELFEILLLLQTIVASLTLLNRDVRSPNILNIRLSGNNATRFRGRVEIQGPNGTWGTICADDFDGNDATVICRMLGFTRDSAFAYLSHSFGVGIGPIWLDDLKCNGTETNLEQCTSYGWGLHNCGHYEDAAIDCEFSLLNIRLAGNGSTSIRGRVEVLHLNGTWGTICTDRFDSSDAKVVCRTLGFSNGSEIAYYNRYFGSGSGPVYTLDCRGHETHINQCSASACSHFSYDSTGVWCDAVIQTIRLVGRRGAHEGRIELLGPDGKWGTLSAIDANAASAICRISGFDKGYERILYGAFFGEGSGPTYYCANYRCTGQETNIAKCCTYVRYDYHGNDIGLSCRRENNMRLVGGNSELEGRVEVYHNGVWGTVCNNGFDYRDAEVICYTLGYDTRSIQLYTYARYGPGTGQIWLNNLSCNGTESRLEECPSLTWGTNSCSHSQDVGVDCHQKVRLFGGRYITEGYVQIGNDWQTICGYNIGYNEVRAVCHSLHFNTSF